MFFILFHKIHLKSNSRPSFVSLRQFTFLQFCNPGLSGWVMFKDWIEQQYELLWALEDRIEKIFFSSNQNFALVCICDILSIYGNSLNDHYGLWSIYSVWCVICTAAISVGSPLLCSLPQLAQGDRVGLNIGCELKLNIRHFYRSCCKWY